MNKSVFTLLTALAIMCTASGCSNTDHVSTDGSTSMNKVIGVLGEVFEENTGIRITYNATGSGAGIQAVLEGRCDIGLSSRHLSDSEKNKGLESTVLAYDGIAVITHTENPVSDLNVETLRKIYTGEITNWKRIGGQDREIVVIGREAGSGTRDGFESVLEIKGRCRYRQEQTAAGDVITAVSQNAAAIGYTSLASVKDTVNVLAVDGVIPDETTIRNGSYAVQRPFLLITKKDAPLSENAKRFFDYVTSADAADFVAFAGVVAPSSR